MIGSNLFLHRIQKETSLHSLAFAPALEIRAERRPTICERLVDWIAPRGFQDAHGFHWGNPPAKGSIEYPPVD